MTRIILTPETLKRLQYHRDLSSVLLAQTCSLAAQKFPRQFDQDGLIITFTDEWGNSHDGFRLRLHQFKGQDWDVGLLKVKDTMPAYVPADIREVIGIQHLQAPAICRFLTGHQAWYEYNINIYQLAADVIRFLVQVLRPEHPTDNHLENTEAFATALVNRWQLLRHVSPDLILRSA